MKVEDLPDSDEWRDESGTYQDAYVIYKHGWILWIPVWNWDARYVLSFGGERFYEFADESDKAQLVSKHGPPGNAILFWDKIGGKILWALVLGIWALYKWPFLLDRLKDRLLRRSDFQGGQAAPTYNSPSPPLLAAPPSPPADILISRNGQQYGPYTHTRAKAMLASGELNENDNAWFEGAAGWIPLNQVPGIDEN